MQMLKQTLWSNTLVTWLLALLIAALIFLVLNALKKIASNRALAWVRQTETDLDDLVIELFNRTWHLFLLAVSGYVGSQLLVLPEIELGIRTAMVILFLIQGALWGTGVIDYLVSHQKKEQAKTDLDATTTISALSYVGKGALWTVVVLLALDNVPSVEVDALIASLGIGGVAVALAVQNILGDLFASLSIVLDKPFVIGGRHHGWRPCGNGGTYWHQEHSRAQPDRRASHLLEF